MQLEWGANKSLGTGSPVELVPSLSSAPTYCIFEGSDSEPARHPCVHHTTRYYSRRYFKRLGFLHPPKIAPQPAVDTRPPMPMPPYTHSRELLVNQGYRPSDALMKATQPVVDMVLGPLGTYASIQTLPRAFYTVPPRVETPFWRARGRAAWVTRERTVISSGYTASQLDSLLPTRAHSWFKVSSPF